MTESKRQPNRTTTLVGVRVPIPDFDRWQHVAERNGMTVQELMRRATDWMCVTDDREQAELTVRR